ncbi:MAG: formiminoglutamase [Rubritalea sp.]|jgi:formiminoglutamase
MNKHFTLFTKEKRATYISSRQDLDLMDGLELEDTSISFAQSIEVCEDLQELPRAAATYMVIGIPEDIGVRANMGRVGACEAWGSFLKSFMGLQQTTLNDGSRFCVLGHVTTKDLMSQAHDLDSSIPRERKQLSDLVKLLDQRVGEITSLIIAAGKIPIVIGGGHNNSYPLLRACGYSTPVDCINIDAHTDLRAAKGRHSGNGFSHAIREGYLKNYYLLGIQENYLSQPMIDFMDANERINYSSYITDSFDIVRDVQRAMNCMDSSNFALEIDMDVVAHFPSSAQSPVGYSFQELRNTIKEILNQAQELPKYIHICEAAPRYGYDNHVGKALATLVNDLP